MKTIFTNLFKTIGTFFSTHSAVVITASIAVTVAAVAVPVGFQIARSPTAEPHEGSQSIYVEDMAAAPSDGEVIPEDSEQNPPETTPVSADTSELDASTSPSKPAETTTAAAETTTRKPASTKPKPVETQSKPVETEAKETGTSKPSANTPVVKQSASLKTGISWDGVSPIVFTYPDGTTGTEIRVGATYESLPGKFATVTKYQMPEDPSETTRDLSLCSHCGREGGDGTNGTCKRYWTGGDHVCQNCGVTIPVKTCHTCNN